MITVYGASDDLIEVEDDSPEASLREEFTCTDRKEGDVLAFSDGTALRIRYDAEGNWRITPIVKGSAFKTIEQTDGEDGYSDRAFLGDDVSWVAHATEIVKG